MSKVDNNDRSDRRKLLLELGGGDDVDLPTDQLTVWWVFVAAMAAAPTTVARSPKFADKNGEWALPETRSGVSAAR